MASIIAVRLWIKSKVLDPDEITGILGRRPSRVHRMADDRPVGGAKIPCHGWILDGEAESPASLSTQLEMLASRVLPDQLGRLRAVDPELSVDIVVDLDMHRGDSQSECVEEGALAMLVERHASLCWYWM